MDTYPDIDSEVYDPVGRQVGDQFPDHIKQRTERENAVHSENETGLMNLVPKIGVACCRE